MKVHVTCQKRGVMQRVPIPFLLCVAVGGFGAYHWKSPAAVWQPMVYVVIGYYGFGLFLALAWRVLRTLRYAMPVISVLALVYLFVGLQVWILVGVAVATKSILFTIRKTWQTLCRVFSRRVE